MLLLLPLICQCSLRRFPKLHPCLLHLMAYCFLSGAVVLVVQIADIKDRVKQLLDTSAFPPDRMFRARTLGKCFTA
jgi:hypothetical protein